MSRFRAPLLILGLVGAVVVAVAVFLVIRLGRGTPVALPVAIDDVAPGTELSPALFRLQEVRGLDERTLDAYVTADEFGRYVGQPLLETVHAGAPVMRAQVDVSWQGRLTLVISGTDHLVYPLPVTVDQVGNAIVAGDHVDVIFTLGRVAVQEMVHEEVLEAGGPELGGATFLSPTVPLPRAGAVEVVTTTLQLPLAKVILADVPVLRVEREQIRSASVSYGLSDEEPRQVMLEGDVIRLYLEVDREQAEVLSFALHNGALNLPARAQPAGGSSEGFTWDDFVDLIFEGRPQEELRGDGGE
jgi:Flp pilus assembly protein CpaB